MSCAASPAWWSSFIDRTALCSDYTEAAYSLGDLVQVQMEGREVAGAGSAAARRPLSPAALACCPVPFHGRVVCIDRTAAILQLSCEAETYEEQPWDPYAIIGLRVHLTACKGQGEEQLSTTLLAPSERFCYLVHESTVTGARAVPSKKKRRRRSHAAAAEAEGSSASGRWVVGSALRRVVVVQPRSGSSREQPRVQRSGQAPAPHSQCKPLQRDEVDDAEGAAEVWEDVEEEVEMEGKAAQEDEQQQQDSDSDWVEEAAAAIEDKAEDEEEEWMERKVHRSSASRAASRGGRSRTTRPAWRGAADAGEEGGGVAALAAVGSAGGRWDAPLLPLAFTAVPPPPVLSHPGGARPAHRKHRPLRRCWLCPQPAFPSELALFTHLREVHELHCCMYCRKRMADAQSLHTHVAVHRGGLPHGCRHCGKGFTNEANRSGHERVHTGEKPFACRQPHCSLRFSEYNNRKRHESRCAGERGGGGGEAGEGGASQTRRGTRSGVGAQQSRPFACSVCDARFTRAHVRDDHHRTHTNERPFACSQCGDTFGQRGHRLTHERICKTAASAAAAHSHHASSPPHRGDEQTA